MQKRRTKTPRGKPSSLRAYMAIMRARLMLDEQGATAIEYAMIAAGIGAALAATVFSLGSATHNLYQSVAALF
jgi:pilus assembly protein Flp/PilA